MIKNAKRPRNTRKAVQGPENETEILISPKRSRRRLAAELVEPEPSEDGEDDGNHLENDISFMEENSVEFVQELADGLKGDEDPEQFTEEQKDVIVTDEFSGYLMPFRAVLASRQKIFSLFKEQKLLPAVNQVVISNAVQMRPLRDLSHENFKKLQQEFELANASAPTFTNNCSEICCGIGGGRRALAGR